eukprot:4611931-Prorocentrum_lima.AAC.1
MRAAPLQLYTAYSFHQWYSDEVLYRGEVLRLLLERTYGPPLRDPPSLNNLRAYLATAPRFLASLL